MEFSRSCSPTAFRVVRHIILYSHCRDHADAEAKDVTRVSKEGQSWPTVHVSEPLTFRTTVEHTNRSNSHITETHDR